MLSLLLFRKQSKWWDTPAETFLRFKGRVFECRRWVGELQFENIFCKVLLLFYCIGEVLAYHFPKSFLRTKIFLLTVYRDFKKSKIVSLARLKKEFLELFCELFGKFLISCREKRYVLFIVSKVLRLFFPSFTEYIVYNTSQVWIALSIETNQ